MEVDRSQQSISSTSQNQNVKQYNVASMPVAGKPTLTNTEVYIGGEVFSDDQNKKRSFVNMPAAGKPTVSLTQSTIVLKDGSSNVSASQVSSSSTRSESVEMSSKQMSEVERLRLEIDARSDRELMLNASEQRTSISNKGEGRKLSSIHEDHISMSSRRQQEMRELHEHSSSQSTHLSSQSHSEMHSTQNQQSAIHGL